MKQISAGFSSSNAQDFGGMNALPVHGAGTTSSNIGVGPAVGIFIDGAYPSRPGYELSPKGYRGGKL